MRKLAIVLAALFAVSLVSRVAMAAEEKEMKGVLIDKMCADKMVKGDDAQTKAAGHKVACAKKCADSGYGVMTDGKFSKFDDAGNKLAKEYLDKADAKTEVTVKGEVKEDGTIAVKSIDPQS